MAIYKTTGTGKRNWKAVALASLARIPNVSEACRRAKVVRQTYENHYAKDAEFRDKCETAIQAGIEKLEKSAFKRANEGTKYGVWKTDKDGNPIKVETRREFSDGLAMFFLKAYKPGRFKDTVEHTGPDGGPMSLLIVQSPIDPASVTGPPPKKKEEGK